MIQQWIEWTYNGHSMVQKDYLDTYNKNIGAVLSFGIGFFLGAVLEWRKACRKVMP